MRFTATYGVDMHLIIKPHIVTDPFLKCENCTIAYSYEYQCQYSVIVPSVQHCGSLLLSYV